MGNGQSREQVSALNKYHSDSSDTDEPTSTTTNKSKESKRSKVTTSFDSEISSSELSPILPQALCHHKEETPPNRGHSAVLFKKYIYIFGGVSHSSRASTNSLFRYNLVNGEWEQIELEGEAPCPRSFHSAVVMRNNIILFGGYTQEKYIQYYHNLYSLNLKRLKKWRKISATGDLQPTDVLHHHKAVTDHENHMVIIGGLVGGSFSEQDTKYNQLVFKMTITPEHKFTWQSYETPGWVGGLFGHTAVRDPVTNSVLVFGGCLNELLYLNSFRLLDINTMTWGIVDCKGTVPSPRAFHSASYHSRKMTIFGGRNQNKVLDDLYLFDMEKFEWKQISFSNSKDEHFPRPLMCHSAFVENSKLLITGGTGYPPSYDPVPNVFIIEYLQDWVIDDTTELHIQEYLGQGYDGSVFYATWRGIPVSVKKLHCQDEERCNNMSRFEKEVDTLRKLCHPNIIGFKCACMTPPDMCVVTEYSSLGTLAQFVEQCSGRIAMTTKLKIALGICRGMTYLHSHDIVHRHLKPENILLFPSKKHIRKHHYHYHHQHHHYHHQQKQQQHEDHEKHENINLGDHDNHNNNNDETLNQDTLNQINNEDNNITSHNDTLAADLTDLSSSSVSSSFPSTSPTFSASPVFYPHSFSSTSTSFDSYTYNHIGNHAEHLFSPPVISNTTITSPSGAKATTPSASSSHWDHYSGASSKEIVHEFCVEHQDILIPKLSDFDISTCFRSSQYNSPSFVEPVEVPSSGASTSSSSLSASSSSASSSSTSASTSTDEIRYYPPEVLALDNLNGVKWESVDVYSFGIILWELIFETKAFSNMNLRHIKEGVVHRGLRPTIENSQPSKHCTENNGNNDIHQNNEISSVFNNDVNNRIKINNNHDDDNNINNNNDNNNSTINNNNNEYNSNDIYLHRIISIAEQCQSQDPKQRPSFYQLVEEIQSILNLHTI